MQVDQSKNTIQVTVRDLNGEPIRDAKVEWQNETLEILKTVRTDRHGIARLPEAPDGTYVLVVSAPYLMTYSHLVKVGAGQVETVSVAGDWGVTMGLLSPLYESSPATDLTPMPMHGIPDHRHNGSNSVR